MELSVCKRMTSIKKAASLLGISEYTLRQGIKQGLYPYIKAGKKYLIDIDLLTRHLEKQAYQNMNDNKPENN